MWRYAIQSAEPVSSVAPNATPLGILVLTNNFRINTNAYRQCFWCLTYLLHDQALLGQIKKETQPAWDGHTVDMTYLLSNCPLLASFYEEMLRVNNESAPSFLPSGCLEVCYTDSSPVVDLLVFAWSRIR